MKLKRGLCFLVKSIDLFQVEKSLNYSTYEEKPNWFWCIRSYHIWNGNRITDKQISKYTNRKNDYLHIPYILFSDIIFNLSEDVK